MSAKPYAHFLHFEIVVVFASIAYTLLIHKLFARLIFFVWMQPLHLGSLIKTYLKLSYSFQTKFFLETSGTIYREVLFFFKSSCARPRLYFLFIINKFFFYNWCNVMYYCPCLVTSMKPPSSLHRFSSLCFISKILELSSVRSRSWICLSSFNISLSLWILSADRCNKGWRRSDYSTVFYRVILDYKILDFLDI